MRILKAQEVAQKTSMSVSNIRRLAREGKFPKPIPLTENRSGWLESEVDEWISECLRKHHAGGKYAS
jgi:prophage regulatory protein